MTSPSLAYIPSEESQQRIVKFLHSVLASSNDNFNLRESFRQRDLNYARELDWTDDTIKSKLAQYRGDPTKFQNIIVPVVMPQVEMATAYQVEVFCSGFPMFSTVTTPGKENIAAQMDTIIADQQFHGDWITEFTQSFRDGFKYNLMGMEVDWAKQVTFAPESAKLTEVQWQGNKLKSMDLYNTFWDMTVDPRKVAAEGEFTGKIEMMSRIRLKQFIAKLPGHMNAREAYESGPGFGPASSAYNSYKGYFVPHINMETLQGLRNNVLGQTNWLEWAGMESKKNAINYSNNYLVTTLYGRILPNDMRMRGVPGANTPQVWKFIFVNNQVLIYAERLTNAHDYMPIVFSQLIDDKLGYQTKSMANNLEPMQSITSALSNLSIAARRRSIADRMFYDASRINPAHMNNDNPASRIPIRPGATGGSIAEAIYRVPFEDGQFQINQAEIQGYLGMANNVSGLNPARQGQFVKGNKTRFEFDSVMSNSSSRDRLISWGIEGAFMQPIKEILKLNILQFQPETTITNVGTEQEVKVDPAALRNANLMFKLSDGQTPADKMIDGDTLQAAFQAMAQDPQIGAAYNRGPLFSYLMAQRGAKLHAFEKSQPQQAYEQAMGQWQQAVASIAEAMSKSDKPAEEIQKMFPAQPTPEQFGYDPQAPKAPPGANSTTGQQESILTQVMNTMGNQTPSADQPPSV